MTDTARTSQASTGGTAGASGTGVGAGAMLREARERQGLHIAALAASIKIPQRKLEALEAGRFDELPDATFTRALAMTVCRALKIDAAPVMAQLPKSGAAALADVAGGLNAPFRDRSGRADPVSLGLTRHPLVWAAVLVLLAAGVLFLSPAGWWQSLLSTPAAALVPAASLAASSVTTQDAAAPTGAVDAAADAAAPVADAASAPTVEVVHSMPAFEATASAAADGAAGLIVLRATEASWVEAIDAAGQVLVRRVLQPGESLGLDGALPLKLKIGNAAVTQLQFRGRPVDLGPSTKDNIARLELH